ncbi:MAG TPA: discoidin domain-containing protein, partial [Limnochordia bacterium]
LFIVWFDGANGGTGYYGGAREERRIDRRTYYDFPGLWETVRQLQPDAVIFSDAGPDVRWIGNEAGKAPDPHWARIDPTGIYVGEAPLDRLSHGDPEGSVWRPAEADTSIRRSWFYDPAEQPKPLSELLDIYFSSVGRGACLNLNVPPDRRGRLPDADVIRLRELKAALDELFRTDLARGRPVSASHVRGNDPRFAGDRVTDGRPDTYWAVDDDVRAADLTIDLGEPAHLGVIEIEEAIALGQRVAAFAVDVRDSGRWQQIVTGQTIGARRLERVHGVRGDAVRVRITRAHHCPVIRAVRVYAAPGRAAGA